MANHDTGSRIAKVLAVRFMLVAGAGVLSLPGALKLRGYRRTAVDGVTTIDDAVEACRPSGLAGWNLVAFAQRLVARKFSIYSTRNLRDTPVRVFEHGMG